MGALEIVLGIIIAVVALVLITFVLLQSGKDKSLSSTIAGAAETFFTKVKGKTRDKLLSRATTALSVVFVVLVVVLYIVVAR